MNPHLPAGPHHIPPAMPIHPGRRPSDYPHSHYPQYPPPNHSPGPHMPYSPYPHHPYAAHMQPHMNPYPPPQQWQYYHPMQGMPQQWYPRQYPQQSPIIVSSQPQPQPQNVQPVAPVPRQAMHTPRVLQEPPQMQPPTPPVTTGSQRSPSTPRSSAPGSAIVPQEAPQAASASPVPSAAAPASAPAPAVAAPPPAAAPPQPYQGTRMPYYPQLPWFSHPDADFPPRAAKKRRRRPGINEQVDMVQLPSRGGVIASTTAGAAEEGENDRASLGPQQYEHENSNTSIEASETGSTHQTTPASVAVGQSPTPRHPAKAQQESTATRTIRPAVPVMPAIPKVAMPLTKPPPQASASIAGAEKAPVAAAAPAAAAAAAPVEKPQYDGEAPPAETGENGTAESAAPVAAPPAPKPIPKSWADLVRSNAANISTDSSAHLTNGAISQSGVPQNASLGEALRAYRVDAEKRICFLEPRGLVNTGNMCYMNSILQVLVFCIPFYTFLDEVSKRAVHSFKSDTPLLEAMIMFMREFHVIDSAPSVEQLRLRLKEGELDQFGEPFVPEYVYEVIKRLPRFSSMRRGHQQDAEEFLGFLLEGLHDECMQVMKSQPTAAATSDTTKSSTESPDPVLSPSITSPTSSSIAADGWLEVGPKQKASITRSSGIQQGMSPINRIFGGKLRSELRVPGLKNSVTLEPYQPLQLDIGAPNVNNIIDALKGLTRSETLTGEFGSPRGETRATKQVFVEDVPEVLILHLKRFQFESGKTDKIWKKVGYPLDLDLPKEIFPPSKRANLALRPGGLPRYRLIGVVYHHGKNASTGHYTVDVRRQEGREWIRMDDTLIRRVRSEDVAEGGAEEDPRVLAKALKQHAQQASLASLDDGHGHSGTKTLFERAGLGDEADVSSEDGSQAGWNQVNGTVASGSAGAGAHAGTSPAQGSKKWSAVAMNGTSSPKSDAGNAPHATSASGAGSGSGRKEGVKDNKVAYILFYQQVRT